MSNVKTYVDTTVITESLKNKLHVPQPLLPEKTNIKYSLRSRTHDRQLIKINGG